MNSVIVSGRLVYEPELRKTTNDVSFISTRIAVSRNDKNRTTDFFSLKAWNNTAKFICEYFHKGDPIEIRGRLETSTFVKQDGSKTTEMYILADEVSFCLKPAEREPEPQAPEPTDADVPLTPEDIEKELSQLPFEL